MTGTGVYATPEEVEILKAALDMPLIALQTGVPESPAIKAHRYALAHGLPEVQGYYGIDLRTGEFLRT